MGDLSRDLAALLRACGADLVGFADLKEVPEAGLPLGVTVAVRLPPGIVRSIADGPNLPYYEAYLDTTSASTGPSPRGADICRGLGFGRSADHKASSADENRTLLPHKRWRPARGWAGSAERAAGRGSMARRSGSPRS